MSVRLLPGVLLALMLLQACDGTPLGQRLSDSFDGPSAQPSSEDAPQSVQVKAEPVEEAPVEKGPVKNDPVKVEAVKAKTGEITTNPQPSTPEDVETKADLPRAMTRRTLPYRITIRLSSADPAAPAEGVTDALRKAGIGFEVETIEKISRAQSAVPMDEQPTPSP
ncbi:hypothetical protein ACLM44_12805 [Synechococcus sp. W2B2]|uniref:hypothetical protein n=1 Tax=unclassified Synechococcus TaxID=2626047 RepID=UPI00006BB27A|nr:hypothetical protein [Synechococcus sp. WH 7805]EAR19938.1 hypothetical protein WH7805_13498 [Synechococcus sp. WH 7805]